MTTYTDYTYPLALHTCVSPPLTTPSNQYKHNVASHGNHIGLPRAGDWWKWSL